VDLLIVDLVDGRRITERGYNKTDHRCVVLYHSHGCKTTIPYEQVKRVCLTPAFHGDHERSNETMKKYSSKMFPVEVS
jgi:pyruvate/2-oxoacid:ferredoxin oxidoreductase beta subunit